jgi:DNA-binding transcriptional MerR regulator
MPKRTRSQPSYSIGELAEEFAVTPRTIRFYEAEGLLSPERQGTRRIYRRSDRTRLKLILRGRRLGFTLAEIRETFDLYDQAHGEARQLRHYLGMLDVKRAQLLAQRDDLDQTLRELEESYAHCQQRLRAQQPDAADPDGA